MSVLAVCLLLIGVVAVTATPAEYTSKYDNIDLKQILNNDRLLQSYFSCLMDKGKCTTDGAELKRSIPDALQTNCSKCTARQKSGTEQVFKHLITKRPTLYAELEKKYDPKGTYRQRYREEAAKHGIKV